ncbi:MAG: hypothetical protein AAGD01_14740 [Acidobacteriota bacterium]
MNSPRKSSLSKSLIRIAVLLAVVAALVFPATPTIAGDQPLQDVRDVGNGQVELTVVCNGETYRRTFDSEDVMGATHWIIGTCYGD